MKKTLLFSVSCSGWNSIRINVGSWPCYSASSSSRDRTQAQVYLPQSPFSQPQQLLLSIPKPHLALTTGNAGIKTYTNFRNWPVMNSIMSVPIRVLISLTFLQDCESLYPSFLPGLQFSFGLPWFLFQLLTCAPWHCTLSGCPMERRLCRAWHLTKCRTFLWMSIIHFCRLNSRQQPAFLSLGC